MNETGESKSLYRNRRSLRAFMLQREEPRYNYETPGSSSNTDRFTANVWKQTTLVGFGVGTSKNKGKRTYYVVAYFFPRGNQPGEFGRNVLPKGTVSDAVR